VTLTSGRKRLSKLATCLLVCAGVLAFACATAGAAARGCANANLRPTTAPGNARPIDHAILCVVDQVRSAHRLGPLRANGALASVAASEVASMIRWDYFAETGPAGQTPLTLVVGTSYPAHAADIAVGENIAWGTGADTTPARIVAAWMASPPHRANILSVQYHDAGVAVTPAVPSVLRVGHSGATYAFEFGVRRP
jgi:uncharacterized protein YkwD